MFNTTLTQEEKDAGFQLKKIQNPYSKYFLAKQKEDAVVLDIGSSDRIIKIESPLNGIVYSHQRFGKYDWETDDIEPNWKPVRDIDLSLQQALSNSGVGAMASIKIIPLDPTIDQY